MPTQVAQEKMEAMVPGPFGTGTFGVGMDMDEPVTADFKAPFPFTGEMEEAAFVIK